MHSRTKAEVTQEQLAEMINIAGIHDLLHYEELTGGEFNLAYLLYTPKGRFILKIGPDQGTTTLTYEKDIMSTELWAYDLIGRHTEIKIPRIVHAGREVIGNHWFVMAELEGHLLCDTDLTDEQVCGWQYQFGQALAQLHNIKGPGFGYRQMGFHPTWKDAYYDMVFTLMEDADAQGNLLPGMPAVLRFIRKWERALEQAAVPRLVHFDLFDNNVFIDAQNDFAGLIDTERCFFGDYYADFFAIDFLGQLKDNHGLVAGYNSLAEEKIEFTPLARARVALSRLYLGLLMFAEGTTRLAIDDPQHYKRKHLAATIIQYALHELDDLE